MMARVMFLMTTALTAGACVETDEPVAPTEAAALVTPCNYKGGAFVGFSVAGETFRLWTTDSNFIKEAERQLAGTAPIRIPNLRRVVAVADCSNPPPWIAPRPWHTAATPVEFTDQAPELCDATPTYVDAHAGDFVASGYCPWQAHVITVVRQ